MTTGKRLLDDCFLHDKDRLRHHECLDLISSRLRCVVDRQSVKLANAHRRFLAGDISAPRNVPLHTNSAVDGYAFALEDLRAAGGNLPISARIAAGDQLPPKLEPITATRIFTGAPVPDGADTVAMQEDCTVSSDGNSVAIPDGLRVGANIRHAGEDLRAGDPVLTAGRFLRAQDIAAIASIGVATVDVHKPVRIALISSGDELVQPGNPIVPGQTFDSNRTMITALASCLPTTITDLGVLKDDPDMVAEAVHKASLESDLILSTGGASRGEEDHIVETIGKLGKTHLWQIAIKPGRPMVMGQIDDCAVIGLPGNPVAAFVCFLLYCRPAITLLGGGLWHEPTRFLLPAGFSVGRKKPDRREFWRGWIETGEGGRPIARKFERDGSGLISGLCQATGLIEIAEDIEAVNPGDEVMFIPFNQFGIDQI